MAPVTAPNSASSQNATSGATSGGAAASSTTAVNKNMFLQLLVAQLKNQDPMSPADGTQFLTQLAQFQQLEQSLNMGQDISGMRQDLDQLAGPASGTTKTSQS